MTVIAATMLKSAACQMKYTKMTKCNGRCGGGDEMPQNVMDGAYLRNPTVALR